METNKKDGTQIDSEKKKTNDQEQQVNQMNLKLSSTTETTTKVVNNSNISFMTTETLLAERLKLLSGNKETPPPTPK